MSKKRVHEIAKELKDLHGIEFDNKAVVAELQSFGYDVKSHSSSMDEGEANEAVRKIVDKKKPKAQVPGTAPKGFVVRRRVGELMQSTSQAAPIAKPDYVAPPLASAPRPATVELPLPPLPPLVSTPAVALSPPSEVSVASTPVSIPTPVASVAVAAPPVASAPRVMASAPRIISAPIVAAPLSAASATPAAARLVVSLPIAAPNPRPSAPRTQAHVTVRPAGATALGQVTPTERPATVRSLVPTATQAILVSRPLIAIKRVTPSGPGGSRYPMAPGRRAIGPGTGTGPVKEFKVVPAAPGALPGARDFTRKDERKPTARKDKDKAETVTTTDIRELLFGRSTIPVRGKKKKPTKRGQKTIITTMADDKKVIKVQDGISVSEFSQRMGVKTGDIIKKLMAGGKMATANQTIDVDTATIIATDYGWIVKKVGFEVEDFLPKIDAKPEDFIARPPVVTVMGHVDHGKTSLLDAIRKASVATGEAGGITQHVGAYTVKSSKGDITFLDTPGHEAFSAMRARGANITDVVVLVVAADDGVMPQTKEAIAHAQKADVPIVVAINKMDLPGASPDRVKKELAIVNLLAEDWGGEVIMVPVSAKTKSGLDLLLENISLQAEVLELKAHAARPAVGTILEARLEKGRGAIATVLVQEGTLHKGDAIVSGIQFGRVRMMLNDRGELIDEVKPGYSAEVIGLSGVPTAGDTVHCVADEKAAKQIVDHRILKARQSEAGKTSRESLEDLLAKQKAAEQKELKVVLKADVSGSLEAVADALNKLSTKKVKCTIVQKGVGMMTETDIGTAEAFGAAVLGFNSRPESGAEAAAKQKEVKWATYGIIYEMIDAVTHMMEDLLEPIRTEKKLGKAEVRNLFNVPKLGTIAGSSVTEGVIKRSAHLRLWRANKQIHQGKLASLKRFKDDVKEVGVGYECGIGIEGFADIQAGDVIEAFEIEETRPSLDE
jgi:translation initiation factor IF-2